MFYRKGEYWIADSVVAYVEDGAVTLQIDQPVRALPKKAAYDVADKVWFASQMRELEIARRKAETRVIPLTDRRRRSSLRLGGGFLLTQGTQLVVARRTPSAPRRPGLFCEFGGVFEVADENNPYDLANNFIVSLLKESQEVALATNEFLFVPRLAALLGLRDRADREFVVGFQPPSEPLSKYNEIIEKELDVERKHALLPLPQQIVYFNMKILNYENSVKLQYAYAPEISVEITAEVDTSSLECIGVLGYPPNIIEAALAACKDERMRSGLRAIKESDPVRYWDTECLVATRKMIADELGGRLNAPIDVKPADLSAYHGSEDAWYFPLDREIYCIDFNNRHVSIWWTENGDWKKPESRVRQLKERSLDDVLSGVDLGPTRSHFTTEKLAQAIKMHCPLPHLQPFITL